MIPYCLYQKIFFFNGLKLPLAPTQWLLPVVSTRWARACLPLPSPRTWRKVPAACAARPRS